MLLVGGVIAAATPVAGAEPTDPIPGDGVYQVGAEVVPGSYRSLGPSDPDGVCTWTTQSRLDNGVSMKSKTSTGQLDVTIPDTAFEFETEGCLPWQRVQ